MMEDDMSDRICLRCDREIEAWSGTRIRKHEALCDACNEELEDEEELEREEELRAWRWPQYQQLDLIEAPCEDGE
jgi:hypothetical protein